MASLQYVWLFAVWVSSHTDGLNNLGAARKKAPSDPSTRSLKHVEGSTPSAGAVKTNNFLEFVAFPKLTAVDNLQGYKTRNNRGVGLGTGINDEVSGTTK